MLGVTRAPERAVPAPPAADRAGRSDARPVARPSGGAAVELLVVAGLLGLAAWARFWGLLYGLPHSYYPDESSVVGDAHRMATTGDPRPNQFLWPTFWIYVVAVTLRLAALAAGPFGTAGTLGVPALDNMTFVYGVARTVTALAGVLTALGLYAVGRRWLALLGVPSARLYAAVGAGFLALSPVHVQHSHVTSPDVPTTAFLVLTAFFTVRLLETGATRWYVLAGLALGLATAAKYPSALFALAVVLAHLGQAGWSVRRPLAALLTLCDWRLWLAGILCALVFFATSPYILIDWGRFVEDFVSQANRVLQRGPVGEIGVTGPFAPVLYLPLVMRWGLDTPVALLALLGLGAALVTAARAGARLPRILWAVLIVVAFPLVVYVFSWGWQHRFARYLLPVVPFACLLAALGLAHLVQLAPWPARRPALAAALAAATMLWQADGVVRYDTLLTRPDTRTIAAQWMAANLPPGEQVMVEWYGPPYSNIRQMGFDLSDRPLERYLGRSPRFVVTSSFTYDRWLRNPEASPRRVAFYTGLHERATLLYEIRPWPELAYDPVQEGWDGWHGIPLDPSARPGPVLRVYQLTP